MLFFNPMLLFNLMFFSIFVLFIVFFAIIIVDTIKTWNKNNNSPRLTVDATVVSRRMDVTHHNHANAGNMASAHGYYTTSYTSYYVTFQVESGDRMELHVSSSQYAMLAEGDYGKLTFQGTRYLDFVRE